MPYNPLDLPDLLKEDQRDMTAKRWLQSKLHVCHNNTSRSSVNSARSSAGRFVANGVVSR